MKNMSKEQLIQKILEFSAQFDQAEDISQAIIFAEKVHRAQQDRKIDGPHINHVLRVTLRAIRLGLQTKAGVIGSLYHDSFEDQVKRLAKIIAKELAKDENWEADASDLNDDLRQAAQMIIAKYGEKVLKYVGHLTVPGWHRSMSPEEKNKLYYDYVEGLFKTERELVLIKLADFLDNACSIADVPDETFQKRAANKYLKVFQLFIEKIESGLLMVNDAPEVLAELRQGLAAAEQILK